MYKCLVPMAHTMKVPVIGTMTFKSWLPTDLASCNPNHPAYIPYDNSLIFFDSNNFYQRLRNIWNHLMVYFHWYFVAIPFMKQFHHDYFQQVMPYDDYINMEPSVIFYNVHHSFTNRPMNPNVIEVGGIHIKPAEPLPKVSRLQAIRYRTIIKSQSYIRFKCFYSFVDHPRIHRRVLKRSYFIYFRISDQNIQFT